MSVRQTQIANALHALLRTEGATVHTENESIAITYDGDTETISSSAAFDAAEAWIRTPTTWQSFADEVLIYADGGGYEYGDEPDEESDEDDVDED